MGAVISGRYVQYGCGFNAPEGWVSYDSSPSLRILRLPGVGRWAYRASGNAQTFPKGVRYGNIVKGLPEEDGSCDGIYASHVLEHLSRADCQVALGRTWRLLKPGGVFRLVVPDLEGRARRYLQARAAGRTDAADRFLEESYLGLERRPSGVVGAAKRALGASQHLWMYDRPSMQARLEAAGFVAIRECRPGDSGDPMFDRVEDPTRFVDAGTGVEEVAFEARRPL
ncbi:class I SAM-dependent methyltransferase [Roseospira marina]|nr:methyltransferase domain-containing protein [Roseospira marina]MBB4316236.1 SAM-dependent methyltransferase [Roseospira marina]MBB5089405.1 SAM-dependent methyltransferase [Roseospira marina]